MGYSTKCYYCRLWDFKLVDVSCNPIRLLMAAYLALWIRVKVVKVANSEFGLSMLLILLQHYMFIEVLRYLMIITNLQCILRPTVLFTKVNGPI